VDPTTDAYNRLGDIYQLSQDRLRGRNKRSGGPLLWIPSIAMHTLDWDKLLEATGKPDDALHEFESGLETDPTDRMAQAAAQRLRGNAPPQPLPR